MRKKAEEHEDGIAPWMLTYSDLVTQLLIFFVLLFSMAIIDKQKFEQVANSLRSTFTHISSGEMFETNKGKDMFSISEYNNSISESESAYNNETEMKESTGRSTSAAAQASREQKLKDVKEQIEQAVSKLGLTDYVRILEEKDTVILRIDSIVFFDLGSADIKASGLEILGRMGNMLKELENEIVIQGHTDNLPINTKDFPTNWELSTKRATNVVRFLVDKCGLDPAKLSALGYSEYRPIRPNTTEENRQKNRRIDIVIAR